MARKWRSALLIPVVLVVCAALGGVFGPRVEVASAASEDDVRTSIRAFTKVYSVVEENFADQVAPDKGIYKGAIPGMLRTLDPHSNFLDSRDFQNLREDQRGHYSGVGMQVQPRNGKTIVLAPFPGSPAYKAGLRPGDVIMAVNDKPTDNLTTSEVADLLKGPKGTEVKISIMREGNDKPILFNVIRGDIPRKSVQDSFWLKPGIGYLDIESFNETTSTEVEENLKKLGEQNIQGLVLDLRSNPGGLLNEGVAVGDKFLHKGQTIVSHRGRASAEKAYVAKRGNGGRDYPIVVLVNRYSASAAEIVAGALQDHDRGWIVGENTFGKGLVQTVYPLSENTGLALTTAKYYTPSGRLIQRDYSNVSFFDYYTHKDLEQKNSLDAQMTDSGRTVYGGGGIAPDEKFVIKLDKFQVDVSRRYPGFFNFTKKYFGPREAVLPKNWAPDQAILQDFHDFLLKEGVKFSEADWTEHLDWTKQNLKKEMYSTAFGMDEARKVEVETDPEVAKAVESMPKARALLDSAKRVVVQRLAR